MAHDHLSGIAGESLRRSRGNVLPILEDRNATSLGVGQDLLVNVHHNLIPVTRTAPVELVREGAFGHELQAVRPSLGG